MNWVVSSLGQEKRRCNLSLVLILYQDEVTGSKSECEERSGKGYLSTCGDTAAAFLLMVPCWLAEAEAGAAV